jgi:hypothetical protein
MIKKLKSGCEIGSGRFIKLIIWFYALYLADCKSMADFLG